MSGLGFSQRFPDQGRANGHQACPQSRSFATVQRQSREVFPDVTDFPTIQTSAAYNSRLSKASRFVQALVQRRATSCGTGCVDAGRGVGGIRSIRTHFNSCAGSTSVEHRCCSPTMPRRSLSADGALWLAAEPSCLNLGMFLEPSRTRSIRGCLRGHIDSSIAINRIQLSKIVVSFGHCPLGRYSGSIAAQWDGDVVASFDQGLLAAGEFEVVFDHHGHEFIE